MDYKNKYLKYKSKYLKLKTNQTGGGKAEEKLGDGIKLQEKLINAIESQNIKLIESALDDGAGIRKYYYGRPLLNHAIKTCNVEIVKLLLDKGVDINNVIDGELPYLQLALFYGRRCIGVVELLVRMGANINYVAKGGFTALKDAIHKHDISMVKFLLDNGADPNLLSPINSAILHRDVEKIKLLLTYGAVLSNDNIKKINSMHFINPKDKEMILNFDTLKTLHSLKSKDIQIDPESVDMLTEMLKKA